MCECIDVPIKQPGYELNFNSKFLGWSTHVLTLLIINSNNRGPQRTPKIAQKAQRNIYQFTLRTLRAVFFEFPLWFRLFQPRRMFHELVSKIN